MYRLSALSVFLANAFVFVLAAAQSNVEPFLSALGNSQNIKGGQQTLDAFDVLSLSNESHAVFAINVSKPMSEVGYVAVGWGTKMSDSLMLIGWPNSDNTWTISRREASGHSPPEADGSPADAEAFVHLPELSSNDSSASHSTLAFLRPLNLGDVSGFSSSSSNLELKQASGQNMIYAYGSKNPGSSSADASISKHDDGAFGATTVDLSESVDASGEVSSQSGDNPWTRTDSLIVLHALCGGLAWLIITPAAILLARLGRHLHGTWLKLHRALQVVLTFVLTVACVAIGGLIVSEGGGKHFTPGHQALGLVLLILLFIQLNLGWIIHHLFKSDRTKRPLHNIGHMVLGIILLTLGFAQCYTGFQKYKRTTPAYVLAAFILIVIFTGVTYLGSLGTVVYDRRTKQKRTWGHSLFGLGRDDPAHDKRGPHIGSGYWGTSQEKLTLPQDAEVFPRRTLSQTSRKNVPQDIGSSPPRHGSGELHERGDPEKLNEMGDDAAPMPPSKGESDETGQPLSRGTSIRTKVLNRFASLKSKNRGDKGGHQQVSEDAIAEDANEPTMYPSQMSDQGYNMEPYGYQGYPTQDNTWRPGPAANVELNSIPERRSEAINDEIRQGDAYRSARAGYQQRSGDQSEIASNERPAREAGPPPATRPIAAASSHRQPDNAIRMNLYDHGRYPVPQPLMPSQQAGRYADVPTPPPRVGLPQTPQQHVVSRSPSADHRRQYSSSRSPPGGYSPGSSQHVRQRSGGSGGSRSNKPSPLNLRDNESVGRTDMGMLHSASHTEPTNGFAQ